MPKSLAQFITDFAARAGVKADSPSFIDLMSKKELTNIVIEDDLVSDFESNLYTLDSAKPKLKSQLFAEAYNGADGEMERLMDEMGLDDAIRAELKAEKSTTRRITNLVKKVKELEGAKAAAKGGDKSELQAKINELNQKISDITSSKEGEITQVKSAYEDQITNLHMQTALSGYNYALGDIPNEVKLQTAQTIIAKALQAEAVRVINNNGQLKLVNSDGTDYYDKNNNRKDFKSFAEQVLAQNKLLKTNDQPATTAGNNGQQQFMSGTPQTPKSTHQYLQRLDQEIAAEAARTA